MSSLEQQITALAIQIEQLHDAIPVEADTAGVTLEHHRPGNGGTYTRLRVQKGKALTNGKRTMSVSAEDAAKWERKIYARNQQAKLSQCLTLIRQAADVAREITWDFGEMAQLVNKSDDFTTGIKKAAAPSQKRAQPKVVMLKYVFKDAKGATTMNRKVHAIASAEPGYGRWYSPALCGEQPKTGSWGWHTCDKSELSCPKCFAKVKMLRVAEAPSVAGNPL